MASHIFSVNRFRNIIQGVVHQELTTVHGLFQDLVSKGLNGQQATLELPDLFFRYTLSSFGKMAFGTDIGCLSSSANVLSQDVPFATAFDLAQNHINNRFAQPFWQLWEPFTKNGQNMKKWTVTMKSFADEIIHRRLEEQKIREKEHGEPAPSLEKKAQQDETKDLLDLFMGLTQDPEELRNASINLILAGRDTTAQALSWLFVELFAHPSHVKGILKEIEAVLGPTTTAEKPHLLDYDTMKDLPYTQACLSEAIRLHPPVPKNGKRVLKDDVIIPQGPNPEGLKPVPVFAGEQVGWSDWVMARTPQIWGPDCASYNPHRFLTPDDSQVSGYRYVNPGQWKFHVFNGGPRLCLGISLANFEALSFVCAVLPLWKIEWATLEEGQVCRDRNPPAKEPVPGVEDEESEKEGPKGNEQEGQSWPPRYKSSVTHPCEAYSATIRPIM